MHFKKIEFQFALGMSSSEQSRTGQVEVENYFPERESNCPNNQMVHVLFSSPAPLTRCPWVSKDAVYIFCTLHLFYKNNIYKIYLFIDIHLYEKGLPNKVFISYIIF